MGAAPAISCAERFTGLFLGGVRSFGILFISYQENIDTSSALGQALFTIVSAVAQLERDLIRERVSAGIRKRERMARSWAVPKVRWTENKFWS